jgi:hypothetical protein
LATYFPTRGGRIKIQAETLLGTSPTGWVYQAPGTGNNPNAQGGYYYFRSETLDGSVKTPNVGVFTATIEVAEAGLYDIRVRSARDTNDPGDSRNDMWLKVDDDIRDVLPEGTVPITVTNGFVKLKGATTSWAYARLFSAAEEDDANPPSKVYLSEGLHTITFAGRSVGFHIDFFEVIRDGLQVPPTAADTPMLETPDTPDPVLPATARADEDDNLVLDVTAGADGYTLTAAGTPANGSAVLTEAGLLRYTPDADFTGTDRFSYTVRDPNGVLSSHVLTVTVAATPDDPFASDDAAATTRGAAVLVAVLGNDGDADGTPVAIGSFDATSAEGGSITEVGGQLRYVPAAGFIGTDSFSYTALDPTGRSSAPATVTVTVGETPPPPPAPLTVLLYDTDPDRLRASLDDGDVFGPKAVARPLTFVVAITEGGALDGEVGSVRLRLTGDASATRTESGAPYSLFGDKDGDFGDGMRFWGGEYSLAVEVFSGARGRGTLIDSFDFDFTVAAPPPPPPLVVTLVDTDTDRRVAVLDDGDVFGPKAVARPLTLAVTVSEGGALDGEVGSVTMRLTGAATATRTDTRTDAGDAVFSLFGDANGDFRDGGRLANGSYSFAVDVHAGADGGGALVDSFDYDFTVTNGLLLV